MSDTVVTVVAIFLAAILMFIFPLMSTSDSTDDISKQVVDSTITDFVDGLCVLPFDSGQARILYRQHIPICKLLWIFYKILHLLDCIILIPPRLHRMIANITSYPQQNRKHGDRCKNRPSFLLLFFLHNACPPTFLFTILLFYLGKASNLYRICIKVAS